MPTQGFYEIGLYGGPIVGWFLMLLFGFFGLWLGAVIAERITGGKTKNWHEPAFYAVWIGFTLLGGGLGWWLFIPD